MRRSLVASALAATVALVGAPAAAAQPSPPPAGGCNVVFVSNGAVQVSLLGTLNVNTPGTSATVSLGGLAGTIVCPILGGGVPAAP